MCRILAMCGEWESGATAEALAQFGALAESGIVPKIDRPGHKDGWGLVAYADKKIAFYEKRPVAATNDPDFENALKQIVALSPTTTIGHLRKASVGGLKLENTHPFVIGNYSFCHNGSIGVKGDMAGLQLNAMYSGKRKGETDSETLFLYLLQLLDGADNPDAAVIQKNISDTITFIRNTSDYTALNTLFTNGSVLFATLEANEHNARVKIENLCAYYYTLFIGKSADGMIKIICSQELDLKHITWTAMQNHTMAVVNLETGEGKIVPI